MRRTIVGLAIAFRLSGQASEIYVRELEVLKLGTSKTEIMKAIPDTLVLRQYNVPPNGFASAVVAAKSEMNQGNPNSAWLVLPKGETGLNGGIALLFFSDGRLQTVQRYAPFIANDDPAKTLFKQLFALLKEETDEGNIEAAVKTKTEDHITFVERDIEFRIGGRIIYLSMPDGETSDSKKLTGITIMTTISQ